VILTGWAPADVANIGCARAVHALPSAAFEVSGVSDSEPCGSTEAQPLSVGPPFEFGHLRYLR
jgi:hypothetical protein